MAIQFTGGKVLFNANLYALYDFSSFTFGSAGVSGSTPPTIQQLRAAYTGSVSGSAFAGNPLYFTTGSFQGYQIWTVPATATYEIEAAGARSGIAIYPTNAPKTYWGGAIIRGRYNLTQGQKVVMVVGQPALTPPTQNNSYNGPGGGGGTYFVLSGSNTPIIIAGGAGAGGAWTGDTGTIRSGSNGQTTTFGTASWGGAPGGTGSLGGMSHRNAAGTISLNTYDGGGGGGFLGNGFNGDGSITKPYTNSNSGGGGLAFLSGSTGGNAATTFTGQATLGGFGGGGGGTPIAGGGGGGYSGGGGGYRTTSTAADGGGGGGSFVGLGVTTLATSNGLYENLSTFSGSAITNLNAFNSGSGYIKITKL
jgi:hypothetical protein